MQLTLILKIACIYGPVCSAHCSVNYGTILIIDSHQVLHCLHCQCVGSRRSPTLLLMKSYRSSFSLSTDLPSFPTSYPISMWNISSAAEYDEPRTNNASEGGNNTLNMAFNASHPSMWTFISSLRKFHAEVETKLCLLA